MKNYHQGLLIVIISSCLALSINGRGLPLFPRPFELVSGSNNVTIDPCNIDFNIKSKDGQPIPSHVLEIISEYQVYTFRDNQYLQNCPGQMIQIPSQNQNTVQWKRNLRVASRDEQVGQEANSPFFDANTINFTILVENTTLAASQTIQDQEYTLNLESATHWEIICKQYVGLVRAMETFSQLFTLDSATNTYKLNNIPINIIDYPAFSVRGILIDTARHFLPIPLIKETIDAMMFNKLNVLHWHISDDESFPLELKSYPNISSSSRFSESEKYSAIDVADLINYALTRGVRIIPEIDSPGHTGSWLRNNVTQEVGILCNSTYVGQLDPTLTHTYDTVRGIINEINQLFIDEIVHFGGDEVDQECWKGKPGIETFMVINQIQNFTQLEGYYRAQQKNQWKKINPNKRVAYWTCNWCNQIPYQSDDIIHWWGFDDLSLIQEYTNDIILSFTNYLYLDQGFGTKLGGHYNAMLTWADVYKLNPYPSNIKGNVIGAIACLWSELDSPSTHHQKLWPRGHSLAERVWNPRANSTSADLVYRLGAQNTRFNNRGIPTSALTVQICERNPEICFAN